MSVSRLERAKRWFYLILLVCAGLAGAIDGYFQIEPAARFMGLLGAVVCLALAIAILNLKDLRGVESIAFAVFAGFMLVKLFYLLVATGATLTSQVASFTPWLGVMYVVAFLIFEPRAALRVSITTYAASLCLGLYAAITGRFVSYPMAAYAQMVQLVLANGAIIAFLGVITIFRRELADVSREAAKFNDLAHTDYLLGTANRRYLAKLLAAQVDESCRLGRPLSVILLDIDRFKVVNDAHGHTVGDGVLKSFANLVAFHIRPSDTLGRWGGEEFLLVAPGTGPAEAAQLAHELRQIVASHSFPGVGGLTASFGVATYRQGEMPEMLISRADGALYQAKEKGRNLVEVAANPT